MNLAVLAVLSLLAIVTPNHGRPGRGARQSPAPPQWGALMPGPHGVGFRTVAQYDHSRRVAPPLDFEGKPNSGPVAMSLPVSIWYPATPGRATSRMQYGTFAALAAKRTDLTPVTPTDRAAAMAGRRAFAGFAFGRQMAESTMRAMDTTATAAVLDAPPAAGRFPVILA